MHICIDLVGTDPASCLGVSNISKMQLPFYKVCLAQEEHELIWYTVVSCPALFRSQCTKPVHIRRGLVIRV